MPYALILIFSPSLYSLLIHVIFLREDNVLTFRRLLALQLVQEFLHALFISTGFLLILLFHQEFYRSLFLAVSSGIAVSSFVSTLVMLGFLRKSVPKVLAISLLHTILQSSRWLMLSIILMNTWIKVILPLIISFSASILFLFALNIRWGRADFPQPLRVFHSYLEYYLNKNPEPLENIFEEMSEERSLEISMLRLLSKNGLTLAIFGIPVHFGPFGTIGSSPLPSLLLQELENSRLRTLVLRCLSDHSLNIPSRREVNKIKEKMVEALNSAKPLEDCRASVLQRESEGYCVTAIRVCSYCIVLLSCPGYSTEDLPPEWLPKFSSIISHYGLTPLIVSDAHNSIDPSSWRISYSDKEELSRLLEDAIEHLQQAPQKALEMGFNRIRPSGLPDDEVGPGGISALVLKTDGEKHALILIDGNNMVKGMRDQIVKCLKELSGLSTLEIATTDTHLLTGVRRARKGYFPIGLKTSCELLIEACMKSLSSAMDNLSSVSASVWTGRIQGVKVTGGLFKRIEGFVKYCERIVLCLIALITLLCLLLVSLF
jgi:putative membrane protein